MKKLIATLQPFGLALVPAAGFSVVYGLLVAIGLPLVDNLIQSRERIRGIYVDSEGTPVIWESEPDGRVALKYRTLLGAEIQETPDIQPNQILLFPPNYRTSVPWLSSWGTRELGLERPVTRWFIVYEAKEQGRAYFEGFDPESKLRAGFIGSGGFQTEEPSPAQCFTIDGTIAAIGAVTYLAINQPKHLEGWEFADVYLISGKDLVAVDFRKRTVRKILSADNMLSLGLLSPPVRRLPNGAEQKVDPNAVPLLALRKVDRILLLDANGTEHGSFVIPEELRKDTLDFYQSGDRGLAIVNRVLPNVDDLYWFDRGGQALSGQIVIPS